MATLQDLLSLAASGNADPGTLATLQSLLGMRPPAQPMPLHQAPRYPRVDARGASDSWDAPDSLAADPGQVLPELPSPLPRPVQGAIAVYDRLNRLGAPLVPGVGGEGVFRFSDMVPELPDSKVGLGMLLASMVPPAAVGKVLKAAMPAARELETLGSLIRQNGGGELTGAFRPATPPVPGNVGGELRGMQRSVLTPQEWDKLSTARREVPGFREASNYMTPMEAQVTIANGGNVDKVARLMTELPKAAQVAATAKAGLPKVGWYRASTQALIDIFGLQDAPRFAALLAAMSPQTSVENNLYNALQTWKNWTAAGRPRDARSIRGIMGQSVMGTGTEDSVLEAWANNAVRALGSADPRRVTLSGPKVNSFFRNLQDDVYAVTNDAWISNGMGVNQGLFAGGATDLQIAAGNPGMKPGYIAASARQRQAGDLLGFEPRQVQESYWSAVMAMYEKAKELGISPQELLDRGLLTRDVVFGTPDFSSLLKQGRYGSILEQAGYGEQLGAMKSHAWPTEYPALSAADQRGVDATAKTLGDLMRQRNLESRARAIVQVDGGRPDKAFGWTNQEYIPYANSGHLPALLDAPEGTKNYYTQRMTSLFTDVQGHDRLNRALGLETLENRPMTGLYEPPGRPIETQPGYAIGAEVPIREVRVKNPNTGKWEKEWKVQGSTADLIDAGNATRGYIGVQGASPFNAAVPERNGPSMWVPRDKKVKKDNVLAVAGQVPGIGNVKPSDVVAADSGGGINVFSYLKRALSGGERRTLATLLGGDPAKAVDTHTISQYQSFEDAFDVAKNLPGSGAATKQYLEQYIDKLSQKKQRALDGEVRDIAAGALQLQRSTAAKLKTPGRQDVFNALEILSTKGLDGLRQSLKAGAYLPAIAAVLYLADQQDTAPSPDL